MYIHILYRILQIRIIFTNRELLIKESDMATAKANIYYDKDTLIHIKGVAVKKLLFKLHTRQYYHCSKDLTVRHTLTNRIICNYIKMTP